MVDKYKNKSCFDYEWMSYVVLTQNSTYVFNCSLHSFNMYGGARCSSLVRAFAHGAMSRRIDPSWGGPIELFFVPASAPQLI